jgi:hypothetical protein
MNNPTLPQTRIANARSAAAPASGEPREKTSVAQAA